MFRGKQIVWFFVRFLIVYGLLMAPWPGLQVAYRKLLTTGGDFVFGSSGFPEGKRFHAVDDKGEADTKIFVRHRRVSGLVSMNINSRQVGYLPTVVLTSLILATPILLWRRVRAFFWGFLLVNGFVVCRLAIMLLYSANKDLTVSAQPTVWAKTVAAGVLFVGVGQPLSYIVPILIWVLIALRRDDLAMILPGYRPRKA